MPRPTTPPVLATTGPWWAGRVLVAALAATGLVVAGTSAYEPGAWSAATAPSADTTPAAWSSAPTPTPEPAPEPTLEPTLTPTPEPEPAETLEGTDAEPAPRQRAAERRAARLDARELVRRAEAEQRAQRLSIRRAIRADRELATFIASTDTAALAAPATAWGPPLRAAYRVTATFGQSGARWSRDHTGLDLAAPIGTPVAAVAAGTVTHAGDAGAYGTKVEVTHADGTETWYAHLARADVVVGQSVATGTTLGTVGVTGNTTGPHLHLEVRPAGGGPVDPRQALAARGVHL